jgi:hypothetical protein
MPAFCAVMRSLPRTYRDPEGAGDRGDDLLKTKKVHAEVTARDIEGGEMNVVVKHPLAK